MEKRFDNYGDAFMALEAGEELTYRESFVTDCYFVMKLPAVGEEVSKEFNGDSYPCGRIVKISRSYDRIVTENGDVFQRVRKPVFDPEGRKFKRVAWAEKGGGFSMVPGSTFKQNPSF